MKFRRIFILIIASILLFSMFACNKAGKDKDASDTEPDITEETVDLSILEPESNKILAWGYFDQPLLDGFVRKYPEYNFEIEVESVSSPFAQDKTVDLQKLGAAITAKTQPDLFHAMMTPVEAYYSNLFDPVQKYLDVDPNYNIDDLDPGIVDFTTFNGIVYFLPVGYSCDGLVWNKELFEKAGLDPDKPPTTWDEYLEMCEKLVSTDSSGKIATIGVSQNGFHWDHWHMAAFGQDAHYVDSTRLNFRWNTKEYARTFEFIRDLPKHYGGNEKLEGKPFDLLHGNTGFINWNGASLPALHLMGVNFEYGFTYLPKYDENSELYVSGNIGSEFAIPKGAKNPAGGWLLATYRLTEGLLDLEMESYNSNPTGYIPSYIIHKPTREKAYELFADYLEPEMYELMKHRDSIEANRNTVFYTPPKYTELMLYFNEQYNKFLNYEIATNEFLSQLQSYSESLIKEFIEEKTAEGWVFEEGKDGIPPAGQE